MLHDSTSPVPCIATAAAQHVHAWLLALAGPQQIMLSPMLSHMLLELAAAAEQETAAVSICMLFTMFTLPVQLPPSLLAMALHCGAGTQ